MATSPDMSKGEGLTRTYDLLSSLISDVNSSFEYLQKDEGSQHLRRNVVRSTFSFLEGVIQILKFELKADFRLKRTNAILTKKETEILYEVRIIEDRKIPWNIPLDDNLKKTIAIAIKAWNLVSKTIDFSASEYNSFLMAKETRNRLTHPRTYYDIEISDEEIKLMIITFNWLKNGFMATMRAKIEIILGTLPTEIVEKFRNEQLKEY